jgi:hypothetical protein
MMFVFLQSRSSTLCWPCVWCGRCYGVVCDVLENSVCYKMKRSRAMKTSWFLARGFFYPEMEAIRSSETSVHTRSTRRHIPEDGILHRHHCENVKSYTQEIIQHFESWFDKSKLTRPLARLSYASTQNLYSSSQASIRASVPLAHLIAQNRGQIILSHTRHKITLHITYIVFNEGNARRSQPYTATNISSGVNINSCIGESGLPFL